LTLLFLLVSTLSSLSINGQIGKRFRQRKSSYRSWRLEPASFSIHLPEIPRSIRHTVNGPPTENGSFPLQQGSGETLAVNEATGDIVQVSEGGYMGMISVARKSMKLYFLRMTLRQPGQTRGGPVQVVEVDLDKLFADSEAGQMKPENAYQRVCGTIPPEIGAGGDMA
jgi:oligogalacturonide lyase